MKIEWEDKLMADENHVNTNIIKPGLQERVKEESQVLKDLNIQNSKIFEEEITGAAALLLYNLIINPKLDPKREEIIKEALNLFPEPEKPKELEIDL